MPWRLSARRTAMADEERSVRAVVKAVLSNSGMDTGSIDVWLLRVPRATLASMTESIADILKYPNSLDSALAQMTPAQKLALIEYIARSMPEPQPAPDPETQRKNLRRLLDEMANLPVNNPGDGFSGRDHDDILYGRRS
jgi:hypothetical protein